MILSFANQKGGVGKTTSALNVAVYLAVNKKTVCLLDLDPQANLTSGLGYTNEYSTSIYDVLTGNKQIFESIFQTRIPKLDIIPSSIELAGAEIELVNQISRETLLKDSITKIKNRYDYIIIDCPPSLGLLTINALTASTYVVIPVQTEYFALEGLSQLLNTIKLVKHKLNQSLKVGGVILTMYDARTNLAKEVAEEVRKVFGDKVFETIIPRNIRLSESPSHGLSIQEYDSTSAGAQAYQKLCEELISKI
jgi:chromosome partitioning protein